MSLSIGLFLAVSVIIFFFGILGIIATRRHVIILLMAIELMLLAINYNFIIFSVYLDDIMGQIVSLYILTVAAAESAIGLAILVVYYRLRGVISIDMISMVKG